MSCLRQSLAWGVALATAALLLAARPAPAQAPGGYYYETYRYGYNPGYYAPRHPVPPAGDQSLYFGPYKAVTKTAPGAVSPGAQVRYAPAPSASPQGDGSSLAVVGPRSVRVRAEAPDTRARLALRVPEGAEVWFGDVRGVQTGALRLFESPPLAPGKEYVYAIRVVWQAGGRQVVEGRDITVRAGEQLAASFPGTTTE